MIINLGSNEVTADKVEYEGSNVGQALSVLEDELTANGTRIYLDYKDGKYGYNTDALRGAETFSPFSSGDEQTTLTTVLSVTGDKLPIITGSGYITLRRIGATGNTEINVFIDGNTQGFKVNSIYDVYGVQGDFYRFYFQRSISFTGGKSTDTYFYQTLLADTLIDKYNITQGVTSGSNYTTVTGKGKILISPSYSNPAVYYSLDGGAEQMFSFYGYQYMEIMFNKSFKFKTSYSSYPLYYIAYLEK